MGKRKQVREAVAKLGISPADWMESWDAQGIMPVVETGEELDRLLDAGIRACLQKPAFLNENTNIYALFEGRPKREFVGTWLPHTGEWYTGSKPSEFVEKILDDFGAAYPMSAVEAAKWLMKETGIDEIKTPCGTVSLKKKNIVVCGWRDREIKGIESLDDPSDGVLEIVEVLAEVNEVEKRDWSEDWIFARGKDGTIYRAVIHWSRQTTGGAYTAYFVEETNLIDYDEKTDEFTVACPLCGEHVRISPWEADEILDYDGAEECTCGEEIDCRALCARNAVHARR